MVRFLSLPTVVLSVIPVGVPALFLLSLLFPWAACFLARVIPDPCLAPGSGGPQVGACPVSALRATDVGSVAKSNKKPRSGHLGLQTVAKRGSLVI